MSNENKNAKFLIKADNITKIFGGTKVLDDVSLTLNHGEIHCLCGENGAGKSTLIKILSGAYQPDGGSIELNGEKITQISPLMAKKSGIEVIHQEIILVKQLSVAENIFPVPIHKTRGFFSMKKTAEAAKKLMEGLNIKLDPYQIVNNLTVAEQQFVKILRALAPNPKILIMDEPTAMFNMNDTEMVLDVCRNVKKNGIGIIYISHHLEEVKSIADRVTVLRDGKRVSEYNNDNDGIDLNKIATDMVGRPVDMFYEREASETGDEFFKVERLKLSEDGPEISFSLKRGEILGITGMVGSGRSEIIRAIYGLDKKHSGNILMNGKTINIRKPEDSINHGIGFISEDRQRSGLVLPLSILKNITMLRLPRKGIFINLKKEASIAEEYVNKLDIKTTGVDKVTAMLSGGNQQKVIIGKWLHNDFEILILDEPTKGIDVNAKFEIYKLLHDLTKEGKSLIIVSSDMPEVISLCDRVLIVRNGEIRGEFGSSDITEENIIRVALEVS